MAGFAPAVPLAPITRRESRLIIPAPPRGQSAVLPPALCIRCGAPADGKAITKTYSWHHPALYLLLLGPILIYLIVAMVVRKSIKVTVPICAQHRQRRSIAVTLSWVLPLVGIADAIILPQFNVDTGIVALICAVLILAGIVIWAVVAMPIRPKKIDQFHGEFTGFCETFLEQFPEFGAQQPMAAPGQFPPPPPITR
jgi:hypothetical protein